MNEYQMLAGLSFSANDDVVKDIFDCLMSYGHSKDSANEWLEHIMIIKLWPDGDYRIMERSLFQ
jgi:hypothetical protein